MQLTEKYRSHSEIKYMQYDKRRGGRKGITQCKTQEQLREGWLFTANITISLDTFIKTRKGITWCKTQEQLREGQLFTVNIIISLDTFIKTIIITHYLQSFTRLFLLKP